MRAITMIKAVFGSLLILPSVGLSFGPACCFCDQGHCQVEVGCEEVEETCYDVECEAICIPPLRFPWECGPLKKCGKVRVIRKLTEDKVTKKVCTYDWSAVACCPDCRKRCAGMGCDAASCDAMACDSTMCAANSPSPAMQLPTESRIALVKAIQQADADDSGWVHVSAKQIALNRDASLSQETGLIEIQVQPVDAAK
ncbi:MAG: hypothetical protein AAGD07_03115 [Planctomycetota bacterium]